MSDENDGKYFSDFESTKALDTRTKYILFQGLKCQNVNTKDRSYEKSHDDLFLNIGSIRNSMHLF